MFNAASPDPPGTSYSKAPLPGSIRQPTADEFRGEMVPDWNNIGLFTAGIAVGAILGAATALLFAPASGGEFRDRVSRRGSEGCLRGGSGVAGARGAAGPRGREEGAGAPPRTRAALRRPIPLSAGARS